MRPEGRGIEGERRGGEQSQQLCAHAPFLVAAEPVDAEPTLSSTAMHEGMTKEGSGLPVEGEQAAAYWRESSATCLHSRAWCNPCRCP